MVNRIILIAVTLFAPYVVSAQEQVTEVESAAGSMVIIYVILAILALCIVAVYILLSKKCEKLTSKQHVLKSKIDDLSAPMWDGNLEKLERRIKQLEDRLKQFEEKEVPQEIKVEEDKKEEVKEEPEDQPAIAPETPKQEVYYANYRPHDEFFNLSNTENDGWLIWKITKLSANEASYELADVEPSKYADQWFKISNIVKCDTPPSGNITSARTIKSGRLVNNDGYWRVDPEHIVEIEFKCE